MNTSKNILRKKNQILSLLLRGENVNMLTSDDVLDLYLNMKKAYQKVKAVHPYPIHHTDASGWFTVVDDLTAAGGKRKIRKSSEAALWEALIDWYIDNSNYDITMAELYERWFNWKSTPKNESSMSRYAQTWKTYYLNDPLSQSIMNKKVRLITVAELREWAESLMRKYQPNRKKFMTMFAVMDYCMEYAADEDRGIISENLWQKAKKKVNRDLIVPTLIPDDNTQVFTVQELRQLKELIYQNMRNYPTQVSSAGLQILFLLQTALRIGECCGLKWTDVQDNRLFIRRQANNRRVKHPKTQNGCRDIPLTDEALRILEEVRQFNEEHGYDREWIFQSNNPNYGYRLSYNAAEHLLNRFCRRMGTPVKGTHSLRKTVLSTLLDNPDVNDRTVQKFAGHSDINTTMRFYNYDRRVMEQQANAIDSALYFD